MAPPRATAGALRRDERGVVAVGDEADLLAVRLVRHLQPEPPRLRRAPRGLVSDADRKHAARELILRQREQEVRLVLVAVGAALQQPAAVGALLDARVVAGGHVLGAEAARAIEQRRELQVAVAVRAGERRAPGRVLAARSWR